MQRYRVRPVRGGFTVTELFVSMGVLGLLVALLLPAVQSAREAARRNTCLSHLRQLGIAAHSYEASCGFLTPGRSQAFPYLPELGRSAEWQAIDRDDRDVIRTLVVPELLCPSDQYGRSEANRVSYVGNTGVWIRDPWWGCHKANGLRIRDITDGLSQTAFFSESLSAHPDWFMIMMRGDPIPPPLGVWNVNVCDSDLFLRTVEATQLSAIRNPPIFPSYSGNLNGGGGYMHLIPPNGPSARFVVPCDLAQAPAARSSHTGSVNLLLADGSARTISSSIDLNVWWALGTRAGSDTASFE